MASQINEIENYVEGKMDADTKAQFERKMNVDPELKAAVKVQAQLFQHLEYLFAEGKVREATSVVPKKNPLSSYRSWFILCLLIFVLAGFWYIYRYIATLFEPAPPASVPESKALPPSDKPMASITPPPAPPARKTTPIAGVRPSPDRTVPVYRDLAETGLPEESIEFFARHFQPLLPFEGDGRWKTPVSTLTSGQPQKALTALRALPAEAMNSDTAQYLRVVAQLLLYQPASAETALYTLERQTVWTNETRRLLVWALLLQGKDEQAAATLRLLPDGFQDKSLLQQYLDTD